MPAIFTDLQQIKNQCAQWARGNSSLIIGIDGAMWTGKTTIGDELVSLLNADILHLDEFYRRRNDEYYIGGLDYMGLKARVQANRGSGQPLVIEGICLWQAVEKIPLSPDFVIYIKRMTDGGWADENICDPLDYETTLANLDRCIENHKDTDGPKLDKRIAQYHYEFKPLDRATVIFHKKYGKVPDVT